MSAKSHRAELPATSPALPSAAVDAFFAHLAHERQYSPRTVDAYRRDLSALASKVGEPSVEALTQVQLRTVLARMHAAGLSARSLARMLSAWRAFYAFLVRRYDLSIDPCAGLRAPKAQKRLPQVLSVDQAQAVLDATAEGLLELRDKAIFELMYSSGLRLAEIVSLDDPRLGGRGLDLANREVTVTGKRQRTRNVPLGSAAHDALRAWIGVRDQISNATEAALFVSRRGSRLSARMVQMRLKRWAVKQGSPVPLYPHLMRHSFASHVLQSSGDLRAVQEMLGHASIATTQVYTHLDFQHLAKVYDTAHPRARKR